MAEAVGLVNTLQNWTVVDKIILSTKTPDKKRIFGKGNFQMLTGLRFFPLVWGKIRFMRWFTKNFLISGEYVQRKSEEPPASRPCLWTSSVCRRYRRWESVIFRWRRRKNGYNGLVMFICFLFCCCRESCRRPGGWRCSTGTHWFCIFSAVMPEPRRPNCRSRWRRFHCSGSRLKHSKLTANHFLRLHHFYWELRNYYYLIFFFFGAVYYI